MKYKLTITLIAFAFQLLNMGYAQTNVSGTLTTDTKWTIDGSPYILTSTVGVFSGITLTINSGVEIQGNFDLLVKGKVSINGASSDSVVFNQTRLIFKNTDLSNSSLQYLKLINNSKIQLSDNNSDNNFNTLSVTHLLLKNSSLITKGYDSNASLVVSNAKIEGGTVQGDSPRSESITITNSAVVNSNIVSYSYNKGIFMEDSQITSTILSSGCCGANINLTNCFVTNSSFEQANGSQPGSGNGLNISNSEIFNSTVNMPLGTVNVSESIVIYNTDFTGSSCFITGNGTIKNTSFTGNGDDIAIERGPSFYGYDNKNPYIITGSSFENFETSIKINDGTYSGSGDGIVIVSQCNFLQSNQYHLMNVSIYDILANQNFWGTTDEDIMANQIFDGFDDLNFGIVNFSDYLSSPMADEPISIPQNLFKGFHQDGIYISWDANEQTNIAGYKVYTKETELDEYSLFSDVGNVTTLISDQISNDYLVAIKGYSSEADGKSDLIEGNESDFSKSAESYISSISLSSSSLCEGKFLEVSLNSDYIFSDNEFILQLSDINGSFKEAVNLDSVSDSSETLSSLIPDTLQKGETYLVRVFSSQLSVFSESFEIIPYSIPNSTFESESLIFLGEASTITYAGNGSTEASYNWDFDGGTIISGSGQGPYEVSWGTEGTKSISLEVIENGCSSFSVNQLEIKKTVLAINIASIQLEIFPNPAFDYINLTSENVQLESYELITTTGQVIQNGDLTRDYRIELSNIESGVYLLKIISIHGSTIKRLVKD